MISGRFFILKVQQSFNFTTDAGYTVAVARYYKTLQKGDPTSFFFLSLPISHTFMRMTAAAHCFVYQLDINTERKKNFSRTCHKLCDAKTNLKRVECRPQ